MFNQSISISSGINNKQKETGSGNLESDCLASQESKAGSALGRRQLSFLLAGRWGDARAGATQTEERPQLKGSADGDGECVFWLLFSTANHQQFACQQQICSTEGLSRRRWRMCILVVVQDCKSVVDTQIVDALQY